MSENGDGKIVLKVEKLGAGLKVVFGEGCSYEVASLSIRLASLELDNRLIGANTKKPSIVQVPMTILDKMNKGMRLN